MKLKTTEVGGKTYAEVQDGKPVYVHDDGKESAFDAPHTAATIARLNGEAKGHREGKEAAEAKLKGFDGIEDAEAARKAMETVKSLDQGQLVASGKVKEIQEAAARAAEDRVQQAAKASGEKIQSLEKQLADLSGLYDNEKVTNAFSGSKYLSEKVAWPADAVQKIFGGQFKREEGKLVGYDGAGNKLYSRAKPGEVADFDEAIEMTIDSYPHRDMLLKGSQSSGSGARAGNGGGNGAGKTLSRSAFEALAPLAKSAAMKEGTRIVD